MALTTLYTGAFKGLARTLKNNVTSSQLDLNILPGNEGRGEIESLPSALMENKTFIKCTVTGINNNAIMVINNNSVTSINVVEPYLEKINTLTTSNRELYRKKLDVINDEILKSKSSHLIFNRFSFKDLISFIAQSQSIFIDPTLQRQLEISELTLRMALNSAIYYKHAHLLKFKGVANNYVFSTEIPTKKHDLTGEAVLRKISIKLPEIIDRINQFLTFEDIPYPSPKNLLTAACKNKTSLLETCLRSGININTQDERGNTALHISVERNDLKMVNTLLNHKLKSDEQSSINVDIQNNIGETALHLAARVHKNKDMIRLLFDHNANSNALIRKDLSLLRIFAR